jgi:hypothetical protein
VRSSVTAEHWRNTSAFRVTELLVP